MPPALAIATWLLLLNARIHSAPAAFSFCTLVPLRASSTSGSMSPVLGRNDAAPASTMTTSKKLQQQQQGVHPERPDAAVAGEWSERGSVDVRNGASMSSCARFGRTVCFGGGSRTVCGFLLSIGAGTSTCLAIWTSNSARLASQSSWKRPLSGVGSQLPSFCLTKLPFSISSSDVPKYPLLIAGGVSKMTGRITIPSRAAE